MVVMFGLFAIGNCLISLGVQVPFARALDVGLPGGIRADGEHRNLLLQFLALTLWTRRRLRAANQQFKNLAAVLAFKFVDWHSCVP